MSDLAKYVWRDWPDDGIPSATAHEPKKVAIRQWGSWIEAMIQAGALGDNWKATKALLDADLAHAADSVAVVYADSTAANNGFYVKVGTSGSGSWSQIMTFLPGYQFVTAVDDGSSTANAMTMNTAPKLPVGNGVALVCFTVPETNTDPTVTITFDNGSAFTIKTASGNSPAIGGLVKDMPVIGVTIGSTFFMRSDQASDAIQTASEAAQAAAEAAQAAAEAARDAALVAAASLVTRKYYLNDYVMAPEVTDDAAFDRIIADIGSDTGVFEIQRPRDRETVFSSRHEFSQNIVFSGGRDMRVTTATAGLHQKKTTIPGSEPHFFLVRDVRVVVEVARTAGVPGQSVFGIERLFIGSFAEMCGGFVNVEIVSNNVNDNTLTLGDPLYAKNAWYGVACDINIWGPNNTQLGNGIVFDGLCAQWKVDNVCARFIDTAVKVWYASLKGINFAAPPSYTLYETVTGGTSGATGIVVGTTDYGVTTRILLDNVVGTFINGETITGGTSAESEACTTVENRKFPSEGIDVTGGAALATNHFVTALMPANITRRGVGLNFFGGHGSCYGAVFKSTYFDQISIIGMQPFYRQGGTSGADVEMSYCSAFVIAALRCVGTGTTSAGVVLYYCGDGVVMPNVFAQRNIGIQFDAGCARIDIHQQQYGNGVTTPYSVHGSLTYWPTSTGLRFIGLHDRPAGAASIPRATHQSNADENVLRAVSGGAGYSSTLINGYTVAAAGTGFNLLSLATSTGADAKFTVRGDGTVFSDGGTAMTTPADYAEMFEWLDGNPDGEDRVGMAVVLDGAFIREALEGEDPIGVVSGNPAVLGDAGDLHWTGKYARDAFNRPVMTTVQVATWETVEDEVWTGEGPGPRDPVRVTVRHSVTVGSGDAYPDDATITEMDLLMVSDSFDPEADYTPRRDRPEWDAVGVVGKLAVRAGQVVSSRWRLMKALDAETNLYWVR